MANFWVAKEVHYTLSTVIDLNNLLKLLHLGVKWIKPTYCLTHDYILLSYWVLIAQIL
jgi:hypothetical protein